MVMQVVSMLVELVRLRGASESDKDLEILLLRRQLAIYERRQERTPRMSRGEKLSLVVLATKLKTKTGRTIKAMSGVIRIVKPCFRQSISDPHDRWITVHLIFTDWGAESDTISRTADQLMT